MIKRLMSIALLILLAFASFQLLKVPARTLPWERSYLAAKERARNEDKFLLAYLHTEWCTYCRQMEKTTLRDTQLIDSLAEDYVWVKLDAEKDEEGVRLNQKFEPQGYPTILILDPFSGMEIDRLQGYFSSNDLREGIENRVGSEDSFSQILKSALRQQDSAGAQFSLGEKYLERGEFEKAAAQFRKTVELDPQNNQRLNDTSLYFEAFAFGSANQPEKALLKIEELEEAYPDSSVLAEAWVLKGQIHHYAGRDQQAREVFKRYLDRFSDHPYAGGVLQTLSEIENQEKTLLIDH